jgi:group I intron endonuclease
MGEIYLITCQINNKKYIGQVTKTKKRNYLKRWEEHLNESKGNPKIGCIILNNAINKYGSQNFKITVLEKCSIEKLDELEIHYIKKLNTLEPNGYNIRTGGKDGKHSDESRQRMREAKLGKKNYNFDKPRSDITKGKISLAKKGEKHHFYNKHLSYEHKLKLSKSHKKINNLPMYLIQSKHRPKQYQSEGYAVVNHPNGKNKYFTSKKFSLEEKYTMALEYLNKLNNNDVKRLDGNGSVL